MHKEWLQTHFMRLYNCGVHLDCLNNKADFTMGVPIRFPHGEELLILAALLSKHMSAGSGSESMLGHCLQDKGAQCHGDAMLKSVFSPCLLFAQQTSWWIVKYWLQQAPLTCCKSERHKSWMVACTPLFQQSRTLTFLTAAIKKYNIAFSG